MSYTSPSDEIDPMEDAGDELVGAGMHVVGDADDDEDDILEAVEEPEVVKIVSAEPEEEEAPKDGLAELEEMERKLHEEGHLLDAIEVAEDEEE